MLKLKFEAPDENAALAIAKHYGGGLVGEATATFQNVRPVEPEAFDLAATKQVLGGLGRSTIYRLLKEGELERVPGLGRVLITRKSVRKLLDKRVG